MSRKRGNTEEISYPRSDQKGLTLSTALQTEVPNTLHVVERAVVYLRHPERVERSAQSLGLHTTGAYCREHNYAIEQTFMDQDSGVSLRDRPGLAALRSYVTRTRPDVVVVKDWRHIGKREVDRASFARVLADLGVRIEATSPIGDPRLTWPGESFASRTPPTTANLNESHVMASTTAIPRQGNVKQLTSKSVATIDYVPLTGPVPDGHQRGQTFIHEHVRMTPALAEQFLAVNAPYNRPTSWSLINRWAEEMSRGEWDRESPEGMAFSTDGEMIDGQTRCEAIVKSGCSGLIIPVHHNYDPAVYAVINSGRKRTTGHALHSAQFGNANHVGAAITLLTKYRAMFDSPPVQYTDWRKIHLSSFRVVEIARETPDIVECLRLVGPLANRVKITRTVAATGLFLLREAAGTGKFTIRELGRDDKRGTRRERATVDEFMEAVRDPMGAGCTVVDPRYALHRNIVNAKLDKKFKSHAEQLGLWLRAWEMWCKGEETKALSWHDGRSDMPKVYTPGGVRRSR